MNAILLIKQNWLLLLIVTVIVVFLSSKLLKLLFRFVAFSLIIGLVLVTFFGFSKQQIVQFGKTAITTVQSMYQKTFQKQLESELQNATYQIFSDGTYEIKTKSFQILGVQGGEKAKLFYHNKQYNINLRPYSNLIQHYIGQIHISS